MEDVPFDIPDDLVADDILDGLNESQREAVLAFDGPVLILAGAGTGKTRTITHKIAYLVRVHRMAPWSILAMTFTNKAAGEMRERLRGLLGPEDAAALKLGTFHSIGLRMLREKGGLVGLEPGFVIYDDGDQKTLLGRILKELRVGDGYPVQRFRAYIDQAKNQCRGPGSPELPRFGHFEDTAATVYAAYQKRLRAANAVDFGDLIVETVRLLEEHPAVRDEYHYKWRYVVVDEFQDTNVAQHRMLELLVGRDGHVCVVGDDDQSIYRWRGAEIANILKFDERYPGTTVVRLERNYRSSSNILAAAGAVIANNLRRHEKTLWTDAEPGTNLRLFVAPTEREEAEWVVRCIHARGPEVPLSEVAVFYRTNAQSRVFEDELRKMRMPYVVVGGLRFYERAEVKDAIAYLRLLVNPKDDMALERIINVPARKIGKSTLDKVFERARDEGTSGLEAAARMASDAPPTVAKKLRPFVEMISELKELLEQAPQPPPIVVAQRMLERSGLQQALRDEATIESESRLENLRELLTSIEEYQRSAEEPTLQGFLDQVALVSDVDEAEATEAVTLMTVHAAKGLEFDAVFLTGVEENLLPHFNSVDDEEAVEEERRLCYVAMTRARKTLALCRARMRRRFGQVQENPASRFLREIPKELLDVEDAFGARLSASRSQGFTGRAGASFGGQGGRQPEPDPYAQAPAHEPDYEFDQRASSDTPGPGTQVRHPRFGQGRILAIDGAGQDARVSVEFPEAGKKTIVARFLTLA